MFYSSSLIKTHRMQCEIRLFYFILFLIREQTNAFLYNQKQIFDCHNQNINYITLDNDKLLQ